MPSTLSSARKPFVGASRPFILTRDSILSRSASEEGLQNSTVQRLPAFKWMVLSFFFVFLLIVVIGQTNAHYNKLRKEAAAKFDFPPEIGFRQDCKVFFSTFFPRFRLFMSSVPGLFRMTSRRAVSDLEDGGRSYSISDAILSPGILTHACPSILATPSEVITSVNIVLPQIVTRFSEEVIEEKDVAEMLKCIAKSGHIV